MILIDNILVSDDIIKEKFICNLKSCKGECCVAGEYGAPLSDAELTILDEIYPKVKPYLNGEGIFAIEKQGKYTYFEGEMNGFGTPLVSGVQDGSSEGGACAYVVYDALGTALCGIEQAYNDGAVDFKKPISCHLYPIRVSHSTTYTMLNYDEWDICSAACALGREHQMPVYKFLKEPLIRAFGDDFYEALDGVASLP